jgi:hypothetical protein
MGSCTRAIRLDATTRNWSIFLGDSDTASPWSLVNSARCASAATTLATLGRRGRVDAYLCFGIVHVWGRRADFGFVLEDRLRVRLERLRRWGRQLIHKWCK